MSVRWQAAASGVLVVECVCSVFVLFYVVMRDSGLLVFSCVYVLVRVCVLLVQCIGCVGVFSLVGVR